MKIITLVCLLLFLACKPYDNPGHQIVTISSELENDTSYVMQNPYPGYAVKLHEINYKGHTYVFSFVRDGAALTHAGHCKCNPCGTFSEVPVIEEK